MSYFLLMSAKGDSTSGRSHCRFDTREELAQNLIDLYEDFLGSAQGADDFDDLNYSSEDLFTYIDTTFDELVCLERQQDVNMAESLWIPNTSVWVKEVIYEYLRDVSAGYKEEPSEDNTSSNLESSPESSSEPITSSDNSMSANDPELHNDFEPPMDVDGLNDILIY